MLKAIHWNIPGRQGFHPHIFQLAIIQSTARSLMAVIVDIFILGSVKSPILTFE